MLVRRWCAVPVAVPAVLAVRVSSAGPAGAVDGGAGTVDSRWAPAWSRPT